MAPKAPPETRGRFPNRLPPRQTAPTLNIMGVSHSVNGSLSFFCRCRWFKDATPLMLRAGAWFDTSDVPRCPPV